MATSGFPFMVMVLCISGLSVQGRTGSMDDWIRLTNTLFSNYTKGVYPVYNFTEVLKIDVSMFLLSILDFDELAGIITVNAILVISWRDFRLTWNPSDYGGIKDILINASNLWIPHLYVITTTQDLEPIGSNQFDIRIDHMGSCILLPGRQLRSSCIANMRRFPLDSQVCGIVIRQWGVFSDEMQLSHKKETVLLSAFSPNGEWDLEQTSVSEFTDEVAPNNGIIFTLQITRKSLFFIMSLLVPVLILCFLNPFVFLLPASSGERISFTVTMFLSLAVYMTLIGDNLPKVSDNMAGMTYFLLFAMTYSGLLILLAIFTLRCEAVSDVRKFPRWMRNLTHFINNHFGTNIQKEECIANEKIEENLDMKENENKKTDDMINCIQKNDVMTLIDNSLFIFSFGLMLASTLWFLTHYYT